MSIRRKVIAAFIALGSLTFLASVGAESVYTWVDENGVRHYSQQPPADGEFDRVDIKVQPPTTPAPETASAAGTGEPTSTQQRVDEYLEQRDEAQRQRRLSAAEKAAREQNCQIAQQNLVTVESRTRVMVPEADGTMRQLTDEERLAALEQARRDVEKYCD